MSFFEESRLVGKYEMVKRIAHGVFSNVFEVQHTESKQTFAMKAQKIQDFNSIIQNELSVFEKIGRRSEYLLPMHDHLVLDGFDLIVTPLLRTSLRSDLEKLESPVTFWNVQKLCGEVLDGLAYLHSKHILHRDLHPGNVLLTGLYEQSKICDYGLAKVNDDESVFIEGARSMHYSAGVMSGHEYEAYDDVVSLFYILLECRKLNKLFMDYIPAEMKQKKLKLEAAVGLMTEFRDDDWVLLLLLKELKKQKNKSQVNYKDLKRCIQRSDRTIFKQMESFDVDFKDGALVIGCDDE